VAALIKERALLGVSRFPYTVNEAGGKVSKTSEIGVIDASPRYASLEEFYALNPKCCEFVEHDPSNDEILSIPFLTRAAGDAHTFVRVFYIHDFDVQNSNQPRYRERYFIVSNCGEACLPFSDDAPYLIPGF
jgi:hypothetical protein